MDLIKLKTLPTNILLWNLAGLSVMSDSYVAICREITQREDDLRAQRDALLVKVAEYERMFAALESFGNGVAAINAAEATDA